MPAIVRNKRLWKSGGDGARSSVERPYGKVSHGGRQMVARGREMAMDRAARSSGGSDNFRKRSASYSAGLAGTGGCQGRAALTHNGTLEDEASLIVVTPSQGAGGALPCAPPAHHRGR